MTDLAKLTDAELVAIWRAGEAAHDEIKRRDDECDRANRQGRADAVVIGERYFLSTMYDSGAWVRAVRKTQRHGMAAIEVEILEIVGKHGHIAGHRIGQILDGVYAGNLYARPEDAR